MAQVYLFDWGDTLMVDFTDQNGKMYLWPHVEATPQASATLAVLSQHHRIYIATSAQESNVEEIKQAFDRVGLAQYIDGYFCKANLGLEKQSAGFYRAIQAELAIESQQITMVGDTLDKDIHPALEAGLNAIYYNPNTQAVPQGIHAIKQLSQLITTK